MTEPLIDRGMMEGTIDEALGQPEEWMARAATDAVVDYLRSVLTPEALDEKTGWVETPGVWAGVQGHYYFPNGADLHRRIFGEDR